MIDIPRDIIEDAANGDMEAFERIYKAASSFVYNVALKITRNGADAEEVTQDVFMKIYNNLKNFNFRSAFSTWVYRISVNTAINKYHYSMRRGRGNVEYDDTIGPMPARNDAAEGARDADNREMIDKLLAVLTPEQRGCVVLRELEGLSYKKIAEALRIPINTVRSRLKRAREAMLVFAAKERQK